MRSAFPAIAIAAGLGLGGPVAAGAPPSGDQPDVETDTPRAPIGAVVRVAGNGFEPRDIVVVSLCGNLALNGSLDCDYANSRTAGVTDDGRLPSTAVPVTLPPAPCPCVITIASRTGDALVEVPFEIMGVASAAPAVADHPASALAIADVALFRNGPWTSWFGGSSRWTARVTITNRGSQAARPELTMTIGRTDDPTGFISVPTIDVLESGGRTTVDVSFELEAFAYGDYKVRAAVRGDEESAVVRQLTTHPWGLFAIGAALALAVLSTIVIAAARALGRRRYRSAATASVTSRSDSGVDERGSDSSTGAPPRASVDESGEDETATRLETRTGTSP